MRLQLGSFCTLVLLLSLTAPASSFTPCYHHKRHCFRQRIQQHVLTTSKATTTSYTSTTTSTRRLGSSGSNNDADDGGDSLESARALLFDDQHQSLTRRAEMEYELFSPNMVELGTGGSSGSNGNRKKSAAGGGGLGFGGGGGSGRGSRSGGKKKKQTSKLERQVEQYASQLEADGVVRVPSVLSLDLTKRLRNCVQDELECMRETIRQDPDQSISLFYVPAKLHFASSRGYVLLPFRETASLEATSSTPESSDNDDNDNQNSSTLVESTQALLSPGKILSRLFGRVCDGGASILYDYCVLRTEPGAAGQVVHSDTPYQEIPGLFCAFIALQDITFDMGGTLFWPATHLADHPLRQAFDAGGARKDRMLATPANAGTRAHDDGRGGVGVSTSSAQYVLLKAGDAAVFDMRILHAGLPNQLVGGAHRYILAVTFRNLRATEQLGHKPNLRPHYVGQFTLDTLQEELQTTRPFATVGNGLE